MQFKHFVECTFLSAFSLIAFASLHSQAAQDPIVVPEPIPGRQQPQYIIPEPVPSAYQEYNHRYPELEQYPDPYPVAPAPQFQGKVIGEVILPSPADFNSDLTMPSPTSDLEKAHQLELEKIEKELLLLQQQNQKLSERNGELES